MELMAEGMPGLSARTRLMVVAPHPDDETLAAALLIQQVAAVGGAVRVLLLTDGDNNPWPQRWLERRWRIGAAERQRWGRRRREESAAALDRLGLHASCLEALGWPDMGVTARLRDEAAASVDLLRSAIERFGPDLVVIPSLDDRHPDHGAAHVLCRLALAGGSVPAAGWRTYLVHGRRREPGGAVENPGEPRERRRKLEALEAYASQTALSGGRLRRLAARPERYLDEAAPSPRPGCLPWRPPAPWQPFLRLMVAGPAGVSDTPWRQAPLDREADGAYRLDAEAGGRGRPCFAKLYMDIRSPWIFDRWGWCRL